MTDSPAPDPLTPDDLTRAGTPRKRRARTRRLVAITPEMLEGAPDFAPVPRGTIRYDGWTPDRQRLFIKALAETGCVTRAASWVGMSEVGAYLLRKADGSKPFRKAWAEAQEIAVARLGDIAFDRAIYGVPVPIFHQGEQVGERRSYNDRLLMFTLRHHDRKRYGGGVYGTNRVPPHVRRALRAEWEAEWREQERKRVAGARDRLLAELSRMDERSADEAPPTPPNEKDDPA